MRFRKIIAIVLLLMFCLSFVQANGVYYVNGRHIGSLRTDELLDLCDEVMAALQIQFMNGVLSLETGNCYIFVLDEQNKIYHCPYCGLALSLGPGRLVAQADPETLQWNYYTPCELCHAGDYE